MADLGGAESTPASAGSSNAPGATATAGSATAGRGDLESAAETTATASSIGGAKVPAAKDRTCPYCHVSFTSSSLGRHLDLYIKDRNPKPPDGIHIVEEIRKSRGNITRRQARSSLAKRLHSGDASRARTGGGVGGADETISGISPSASSQEARRSGTQYYRHIFNTPHWTSTGVITDSDANAQLMSGFTDSPRTLDGSSPKKRDPAARRQWREEKERGRAAELALLELTESIKAAVPRRLQPEVWDFDAFSLSFPALCLRVLPPPPTLSSSTLLEDSESWPVSPPSQAAFDAVRYQMASHILKWRDDYYPPKASRKRTLFDGGDDALTEPHKSELQPVPLYMNHLHRAYSAWITLPESVRQREWQLEIMRAYAAELDRHKKTQERIDLLETELARSRLDNARLTECQMPREWLHMPAAQLPMARLAAEKVERALGKDGLDAEKLIAKWRPRIQAAKSAMRKNAAGDDEERESGRLDRIVGPAGTYPGPGTYLDAGYSASIDKEASDRQMDNQRKDNSTGGNAAKRGRISAEHDDDHDTHENNNQHVGKRRRRSRGRTGDDNGRSGYRGESNEYRGENGRAGNYDEDDEHEDEDDEEGEGGEEAYDDEEDYYDDEEEEEDEAGDASAAHDDDEEGEGQRGTIKTSLRAQLEALAAGRINGKTP